MLLQQIINGVMLGSSYSLIAIGYTLVFGVLNLVHLAHGEVFMIGAFVGLQVVLLAGGGIGTAISRRSPRPLSASRSIWSRSGRSWRAKATFLPR